MRARKPLDKWDYRVFAGWAIILAALTIVEIFLK
jgi:hypothetical protein